MIYLYEDTPSKVSGRTSIFIFSDCTKEIISAIESCECFYFHKKKKLYEIPITELSTVLDSLTYLDDIQLDLLYHKEQLENNGKITINYKLKPFPHQEEAIKFGLDHDKWLLLDSPGLGKTASIIHLAEELKSQRGLKHCLIICGLATLRSNWEKEIKIHSDLDSIIIGKRINSKGKTTWLKIQDRANQLVENINEFFVIINVESLVHEDIVEAINKSKNEFDMIVLDECHVCKGIHAKRSKNLLDLNKAKYKVGMTGTLVMNNPLDTFIPLKWIEAEKGIWTKFQEIYCKFGGVSGHDIVGYQHLDLLKDELVNNSLRRTKDIVKLPPKNIIDEYIEMNDDHRKLYEAVVDGVKEECDKIELKTNSLLALTTRLRQASTCPSLLTSQEIICSKFERCKQLVDEIISQGDKVVIMSNFKEPVYELQEILKEYHPLIGTGDMPDDEVIKNKDLFQEDDYHKIFIATVAKCGTGLSLNRARYMICLDQPWTAAKEEQITDRIHRVNNKEAVFIYNLICEDTIDVAVAGILRRKKAISTYMIDDEKKLDDKAIDILRKYILDLK